MEGADGPDDMAIDADQQRLEEEVAENIQEQLGAEVATQQPEQAADGAEVYFESPDQPQAPSNATTDAGADEHPQQPTDDLDEFLADHMQQEGTETPAPLVYEPPPEVHSNTGNKQPGVAASIEQYMQQTGHQPSIDEIKPLSSFNTNGDSKAAAA